MSIKPALMHFEGPLYQDGSGPQITVQYHSETQSPFTDESDKSKRVAYVDIESIGSSDGISVLMPNLPWLISTLQRICQEA